MMKVYEGWTSPGNAHATWLKDSPGEFFSSIAQFENVSVEQAMRLGSVRIRIEVLETFSAKPYSDKDLAAYMEAR